MNIIKQKQTHRYREQTSGQQWGEEAGRGKVGGGDQEVQTTMYKINKLKGYIAQHREYSQYNNNKFKWSITYKNIESLCCIPETNKIL